MLGTLPDEPIDDAVDGSGQFAWEKLTEGMAFLQRREDEAAYAALSEAYANARQADYAIVECFALRCGNAILEHYFFGK